jgi:hypothetical protein
MNDKLNDIIAGEQQDSFTSDDELDNIGSLQRYVEDHDLEEYITEDEGTRVMLSYRNHTIALDSYGLGDFHTHGIDATLDPEI